MCEDLTYIDEFMKLSKVIMTENTKTH